MTRKDFELIAEALCVARQQFRTEAGSSTDLARCEHAITMVAWKLVGSLGTTNPRFDRDRFLHACGVEN